MNTLKRLLPIALCLLTVGAAHADLIKQSAAYNRTVLITSSTDHISGATGLTAFTVTLSKAGGTVATITPTVTEIGAGRYSVALVTGNTATLGALDMTITATGADPTDSHDQVVAFDPNSDLGAAALTGINTKTILIATNAADSPNAAAAQGNASTLLLSLATYQSVLTAGSTASVLNTALVGTADLTGSKVVFTTGVNRGVTRTITSMNSGTGAINLLTATPSTPGATDAFSVVQGSKALEQFLAALGTDSKPFLTATDTQAQAEAGTALTAYGAATGTQVAALPAANATAVWGATTKTVTGGTVTTVTNAVTLPTTAPTGYGGGSAGDTPGTTALLAKIGTPAGASLAADIAAAKSDTGSLVTSVAALPAAVWTYTASDGLTHQQSDALRTAILARGFSVSYNAATRTQVTTYVKADGVTALATTTVVYDTTGRAMTRTTAFTNLP